MNGKGIIYYRNGIIRYEGEFLNGKYEGNGQLTLENGTSYKGSFKNGVKIGKGYFYNKAGLVV